MDATHYDKIADKLIQFLSKLPQVDDLVEAQARYSTEFMRNQVLEMLKHIDVMAKMDDAGWLR